MHQPSDVRLLVFDINSIAYAAAYQPNLAQLTHNGQPTGAIHSAVGSVLSISERYPNALPIALWDGQAGWRGQVVRDYKGNRSDTPEKIAVKETVRAQTPTIKTLIQALGVPQARHPDSEADDLAGHIARAAQRLGVPTRLITTDTDWWQALSDMVEWENTRDNRVIDLKGLRSVTKDAPADGWASPQEYLQAKILAGDKSDNIPGIQGVGLATAAKLLRTAPDGLEGILCGEFTAKGVVADRVRTQESRSMLESNRTIMDWRRAPAHDAERMALWAHPEHIGHAKDIAISHGMKRLAARLKPGMIAGLSGLNGPAWDAVVQALNWPGQADNIGQEENEMNQPLQRVEEPVA